MLKIGIIGCEGRMGKELCKALIEGNTSSDAQESLMLLSAAITNQESKNIGQDIGYVVFGAPCGVLISSALSLEIEKVDVLIDFTVPEATMTHIDKYRQGKKPLIIGTTGFSSLQQEQIAQLAAEIPIILAPNMTIGVNLCAKVVQEIAKTLGDTFDVEIIEAHHRHKVDAPSGTALYLGAMVAKALDRDLSTVAKFAREGKAKRAAKEIGFATVRAGGVFGEHTVLFASENESIEIKHTAFNRRVFTDGALLAAQWLSKAKVGLYTMQDVLLENIV